MALRGETARRAIALRLANAETRLVLAARNRDRLAALAEECRMRGADALVVPTDVSIRVECEALADAAVAKYGAIDLLVLNAGGTMWSQLDELEDAEVLERLMRVNYLGAAWLTRRAAGTRRRAGPDRRDREHRRARRHPDPHRLCGVSVTIVARSGRTASRSAPVQCGTRIS